MTTIEAAVWGVSLLVLVITEARSERRLARVEKILRARGWMR